MTALQTHITDDLGDTETWLIPELKPLESSPVDRVPGRPGRPAAGRPARTAEFTFKKENACITQRLNAWANTPFARVRVYLLCGRMSDVRADVIE